MEKILVTTDLSASSKPGIRFAMQLAKQRNAELIILHVFYVLKATSWSDKTYQTYFQRAEKKIQQDLSSFMKTIVRAPNIPKVAFRVQLIHGLDTVESILAYAEKVAITYICISTRGAGMIKKLFGTNTSDLIRRSELPVIAVPKTWRLKPIKKVLYAADFKGYNRELRKVIAFAGPINARVDMLHLIRNDEPLHEITLGKEFNHKVHVEYKKINIENTVVEGIDEVVKDQKPSVVVFFTHQNRSLMDRILFPGNAEEFCFYGKVPLLTFQKAD
ncbi:universal stress protein [Mucilaginibacter rigui]|uniref:Universal stress protein n=1 Tax=Mucilaginibacter rigui TaxID=534635 RepID=A0ABR7X7K5_9SPHI|nr:universal stress protein [Mucilaginibacter rigui]MBD1386562.1 universal stress protein [Mucilaginibacter rigui]